MHEKNDSIKSNKYYPLGISILCIGLLAALVEIIKIIGFHIVYSSTASMPAGFYLIIPTKNIAINQIVEAKIPDEYFQFIRSKSWFPNSNSIIKYVVAKEGDIVCVRDNILLINNKEIVSIHVSEGQNNQLPRFAFCGKIDKDRYLLLSTRNPRSFDGRYFGLISSSHIRGRAVPIFLIKS